MPFHYCEIEKKDHRSSTGKMGAVVNVYRWGQQSRTSTGKITKLISTGEDEEEGWRGDGDRRGGGDAPVGWRPTRARAAALLPSAAEAAGEGGGHCGRRAAALLLLHAGARRLYSGGGGPRAQASVAAAWVAWRRGSAVRYHVRGGVGREKLWWVPRVGGC